MSAEEKPKQTLNSHISRWLVALVLLPPVVFCILSSQELFFFGLILLVGGLTWWEYSNSMLGAGRTNLLVLALSGWLAVALGAFLYGPFGQSIGLVIALALGAGYTMWWLERESGPMLLNILGRFSLGQLYLSFLLSFFLLLKKTGAGEKWLLYTLVVTITADTAAYYVGRKMQGPKLWPKISPNKTISGLVGGAVAAMVVSIISAAFLPVSFVALGLLGLFLGFWGAMGDLFESALKRAIDIKDSSTILMGHGGFWDRLDALLFNIVPVYIVADLFVDKMI